MATYAYFGHGSVGNAIEERLSLRDFTRVDDVSDTDIVITYCTAQSELEDVYFDTEGLVQMCNAGTYLVDLSPMTPDFAREVDAVSMVSDLHFVEAPLAVRDSAREDALHDADNLLCFVAGQDDDIDALAPLFEAIASDVRPTGGPGSAQVAKAQYSLQVVAGILAAIEADALARAVRRSASGTGANVTLDTTAESPAGACALAAIKEERFSGEFTVEMLMADLTAALMTADDADLILPQAEACQHLIELLAVIGGSDMSPAGLSLVYRDEEQCSEAGLDWTRAEQAYGDFGEEDEDDFDDACGCGCDHGEAHERSGFGGGFGYSAN